MICLLCYETNEEYISVEGEQGKQLKVSVLLYKYFRFCFDDPPNDGIICQNCWQKILHFHRFYIKIQSIHEEISKSKDASDIPLESVKVELDESTLKCDQNVDHHGWSVQSQSMYSDHDDLSSHNSFDTSLLDNAKDEPTKDKTSEIAMKQENDGIEPNVKCNVTKKAIKKSSKSKKAKKKSKGQRKANSSAFTCRIRMCHEEFDTMDALVLHKTTVHRRIQCTHCPDMKLVVDLNKHLRNMHGIEQNSMCEHCGQVYMNTRSLQDHIQRKHEISDPLQCDICKEWFKSRDTIRAHMNYVHVQGPQACPTCGKISANRKALRKHQTIHLDIKRFKCIICERGFRDSTKLKEHSYIHSGITDAYICQFCGQSFRFGSSLSAHRMRYHALEMAEAKQRMNELKFIASQKNIR